MIAVIRSFIWSKTPYMGCSAPIYAPLGRKEPWFYDVLMSRNAIRLAIKSLDRKEALKFRKGKKKKKSQDRPIENVSRGMSCKVKFKL